MSLRDMSPGLLVRGKSLDQTTWIIGPSSCGHVSQASSRDRCLLAFGALWGCHEIVLQGEDSNNLQSFTKSYLAWSIATHCYVVRLWKDLVELMKRVKSSQQRVLVVLGSREAVRLLAPFPPAHVDACLHWFVWCWLFLHDRLRPLWNKHTLPTPYGLFVSPHST